MKKYSALLLLILITLTACSSQKEITVVDANSYQGKSVSVFTTSEKLNSRLSLSENVKFIPAKQPLESEVSVFVNPNKSYQNFIGIGGAVTDASAEVFAKLSPEKQNEFLTAYFDADKGIGYSLLRTTIHSSDFASGSYTYVSDEDKELKTFSVEHDRKYKIPLIKKALEKIGDDYVFYASPWSPPAFMKDNKNMLRGGKLMPEFYQSWANYFVKFINEYEKDGMKIWGVTVQNEPMATQRWESCIYTAEEERDFVKYYLGPTFEKNNLGDKKIVVWDHNRDLINQRVNTILSDPEASKYIWGIGFHWYETWAGGEPMFKNVAQVYEDFPAKNLLFTEGCVEKFDTSRYYYWPNAERYGRSMINDFNSGTVGWTDWNILLDETGGPNHVQNFCFAPIHADTRTGELIYTPSYYYIGHFSKFIKQNAKRISTAASRSHLLSTSFINDDGKITTIVMNESDDDIKYKLYIENQAAEISIPAHSIQSLVY